RIAKQGADRSVAIEPPRCGARVVLSFDSQTVDDARHAVDVELEAELQRTGFEVSSARRQAQAGDFPTDESGRSGQAHASRAANPRSAEEDAFLRQPLERGTVDFDRLILSCNRPFGAIE